MREEREMRVLKKKKLYHSATVPSYIWDGTVAKSQKNFGICDMTFPLLSSFGA